MKHHLQFNWWKYISIVVLSAALWCSVFQALASPGQDEQISVAFIGSNLDANALQKVIQSKLPDRTAQNIRQVTVTSTLPDQSSYKSTLMNYCASYDILIIEESSLVNNVGQSVFARLNQDLLAQFPNTQLYNEAVEDGELAFGLVLWDGETPNTFSACYTGSQQCYVFFSPYSINFDSLNEYGKAGNDAGLQTIRLLME